mmetsp:Transcript_56494/g.132513  ORF Transcript_56494/g.132513 Transcript_56494/m.132513 type:complete len:99 (-) Transcript_56494:112-408(-)
MHTFGTLAGAGPGYLAHLFERFLANCLCVPRNLKWRRALVGPAGPAQAAPWRKKPRPAADASVGGAGVTGQKKRTMPTIKQHIDASRTKVTALPRIRA